MITISRDAKFLEFGNGTFSVEIPIVSSAPREQHAQRQAVDSEINLIAFKEETNEQKENDGADGDEHYQAAKPENESTEDVRRSRRETRGKVPHHFDDYVLDYDAGIAVCAMEEPVSFQEAVENPQWRRAMDEEMKSHEQCGT